MTIGVTGASGALGRLVAAQLLDTVDPAEVVLTSRTPDALAEFAARGAQVRRADFSDPQTLGEAFAGVDKLLLISTDAVGTRLDEQRDAIAAAAGAGVRHVVYTSVPEPGPDNPALVSPDHFGTEQAMRDSGLAWTMLRNNLYTHMQIPIIEQAIAAGRHVDNSGDGRTAYVTREDCAAAAVAVLTQDGHENKAYDITGPEAIDAAGLVALAKDISGKDIELVLVDDESYAAGLRSVGLPAEVADLITSFGAAKRAGLLANVSTAVLDLTGTAPTALADVVRAAVKA